MFGRKKPAWPQLSLDDIKKRARILVVDDGDFPYLPLFKRDGYSLDKWDDVDDLPKLEKGFYDIILLDIQGVGRKQSQEQGFGILKHLRQTCPTQVVIAYSDADWSFKYKGFFDLADDMLAKSADYVSFKETVDKSLFQRFSLGFYLDRIEKAAAPHMCDMSKLRKTAQDAILAAEPSVLKQFLVKNVSATDVAQVVLQIAQVAIALATAH